MLRRLLSTSPSSSRLKPTIRQLLARSVRDGQFDGQSVQVNGWVKSIRHQKRVAFAVLQDGTSADSLQAVFTNPALAASCVHIYGAKLT